MLLLILIATLPLLGWEAATWLRPRRLCEHVATAAALGCAALYLLLRSLIAAECLNRTSWLTGLVVLAASVVACSRRKPWHATTVQLGAALRRLRASMRLTAAVWPAACGVAALFLACLSALWLPVWQWDALGYHLPYANFVLQAGSLRDVPLGLEYIGTYPHAVEILYAGLRLVLPDDGAIELAQVFFGLMGAALVAVLARRAGARRDDAVAAGLLWLTLPGVFLQLPSNYVDVAVASLFLLAAFWVTAPLRLGSGLCAGLSLGMLIGAKPSAPPVAAALGLVFVVRALHQGGRRSLIAGIACLGCTVLVGGESYLMAWWTHGNPVWPVRVSLGPWTLFPGEYAVDALLTTGLRAPHLEGPLLWRVLGSWFNAFPPSPVFDMRIGGFGPLFVALLAPAFCLGLFKRLTRPLALLGCMAWLTPDPAVARYVLGFPAICAAVFAALLARVKHRSLALTIAAACAGISLAASVPALTQGGPALSTVLGMAPAERAGILGPEGPTYRWIELRQRLQPGETAAFDPSFELSYLLWRSDLQNRVVWIDPQLSNAQIDDLLRRENVRLAVVGPQMPAGALLRAAPDRWERQFDCISNICTVYWRR